MRHRPRGFTLIELVVVIALIGVLLALLLRAVQSAREAARRTQCLSNLKQIALAMHRYHNAHSVLPPGKKGCCWGTWLIYVLPQLEQQPLFNAWNSCGINLPGVPANYDLDLRYFGAANVTVTSTRLNADLCPSDATNAPITAALNGVTYAYTSQIYAANFGNTIVLQADYRGIRFGGAPLVDIGSQLGDSNQPARATVGFSVITDGLSNTMLLSEVVVGQGRDLRGFSRWGDAATFRSLLDPERLIPRHTLQPDLLHQPGAEPALHVRNHRPARDVRGAESTRRGRPRGHGLRLGPVHQGFGAAPGVADAEHGRGVRGHRRGSPLNRASGYR